MVRLRQKTAEKSREIILRLFFLGSFFYNKACKLPNDFKNAPMNLFSGRLNLGELLMEGFFNDYLWPAELSKSVENKEFKYKNDPLKSLNPNTFSWLYILSGLNTEKSRDFTKFFVENLGVANINYTPKIWNPNTTALRLCAICLNIRFLDLAKVFIDRPMMVSLIHFHVLYLSLCKILVPKGLVCLRINSGIFFASLILGETLSKRHSLLKKIVKDVSFLMRKDGEFDSRNPEELLEILFLVNRFIKLSSTAELSRGKIDKKLKIFQNQVAPILRGLRLGNGKLVRAYGCGGETSQWNLDKELSDARLKDFSIKKSSLGFYRICAGRLRLIFDGKSNSIENKSNKYCCPAFSFELTSGQRTIFQNNSPFNFFLGHTESIVDFKEEFNSVEFSINPKLKTTAPWISNIREVKIYRDQKNNFVEGAKKISINQWNIIHSRKLIIPISGTEIIGMDQIFSDNTDLDNFGFINAQFFLHPEVNVWKSEKSNYFILQLKNSEIWCFETDQENGDLHKYNFLDPKDLQSKKASKIVLKRSLKNQSISINWRFFLQNHSSKITREKFINYQKD